MEVVFITMKVNNIKMSFSKNLPSAMQCEFLYNLERVSDGRHSRDSILLNKAF